MPNTGTTNTGFTSCLFCANTLRKYGEKETTTQPQLNSGDDPGGIWQITDQHDDVCLKGFDCAKLKCVYVSASVYVCSMPGFPQTPSTPLSRCTLQHYVQGSRSNPCPSSACVFRGGGLSEFYQPTREKSGGSEPRITLLFLL